MKKFFNSKDTKKSTAGKLILFLAVCAAMFFLTSGAKIYGCSIISPCPDSEKCCRVRGSLVHGECRESCTDTTSGGSTGPTGTEPKYEGPEFDERILFSSITNLLYWVGIGLGVFFVILSGYKFLTSQGNPQAVKEAQEQLSSAIVGLVFIILSAVILKVIITALFGGTLSI